MNGTPILVDTIPTSSSVMLAPDILTDDSLGNGYLLYNSPLTVPIGVSLAKITPSGVVTKVHLVGSSSESPLLLTTGVNPHGGQVARIHDDVLYLFGLVRLQNGTDRYIASKCTDLTNIASASCWTKLDGTAGIDLLAFEPDAQFGMDVDSSGKVYISGSNGGANVTIRTFTPSTGWSGWQLVANYPGQCFVPPTNCIRTTDIEVDDDTGIVHVLAGQSDNIRFGIIPITIYARGATPGAIPSSFLRVTENPLEFFGGRAGGIATFPNNKVLVMGSSGTNKWNFFNGTSWIFGTAGGTSPFGSAGNIDNVVMGSLSKAPDGKGRAFTLKLEGGAECLPLPSCNKYQLRTFDPGTRSWSSPTTVYTTPPPVNFSIRPFAATRLDPNPNSCNQWYAWFDPHTGKLFADFEGPGVCIAEVHGMKFNDLDGDGVKDDGEPALEGWDINLECDNGYTDSTTSDENGVFWFMEIPVELDGTDCTVSEVLQPAWKPTTPLGGAIDLTLFPAHVEDGILFGNTLLFEAEKFYSFTNVTFSEVCDGIVVNGQCREGIDNDNDGLVDEDPDNDINDDEDCTVGVEIKRGADCDVGGAVPRIDEDDVEPLAFRPRNINSEGENTLAFPLPIDPDSGKFLLEAVLKKNGEILNYNPGQYYAITKVNVTANIDVLKIWEMFGDCTDRTGDDADDLLPSMGEMNPDKVPGGAAVVIVDPDGNVFDLSDELAESGALTKSDENGNGRTDDAHAELGHIEKGSMVLMYVKFAPGLRGEDIDELADEDLMCTNSEEVEAMIGDFATSTVAVADLIVKPK
jgi:hypothetical protein